jgi:integrase
MTKIKIDLPKAQFHKTGRRGVVYLEAGDGERHYYIRYRTAGPHGWRQHFERATPPPGVRMTAAKADQLRQDKARGKELPNRERRAAQRKAKEEARKKKVETFGDLFTAYLEYKGEYPRLVTDKGNYEKHLLAVVDKKKPSGLAPFDVDRIKRDMEKRGCKTGTVAAALGFLVRLSSFGVKKRLCPGVTFPVELPRDGSVRTEMMTDEQMTAYLKAASECENKVVGALLAFELLTGMRFGEVRKLRWDAVNFHNRTIKIVSPKGGKDQYIPLNDAAADILRRLPRKENNPFVFQGKRRKSRKTGEEAGRIGHGTAYRIGKGVAQAAGLPKGFRPLHGLRHSFASRLASSGEVDLYTVQRLMTHKSPLMTQRYAHLRDEALRRGAEVMGRIVKESKEEMARG